MKKTSTPKKTKRTAKKKVKKRAPAKKKAVKKTKPKTTKKRGVKKKAVKKPTVKKRGNLTIVKKAKVAKTTPKKRRSKYKMNEVWVKVLLKDPRVRRWLVQVVGENAIYVIQQFDRELSDEDIAKKSELRASEVRVVLNRLHVQGLAVYSRSRDKNSGWYSYNWKLDEKAAKQLAEGVREEQEVGEAPIDGTEERYYCVVDGKKVIYTFEQAVELNFKCPRTGKQLKYLE